AMNANQVGTFIKLSLRRAQAISVVNVAIVLTWADKKNRQVERAGITLGAVAPTVIHAQQAEAYLVGRDLDDQTIEDTARLAEAESQPIDDVRASRDYRREMVRVCTLRGLRDLAANVQRSEFPAQPVMLWGQNYLENEPYLSESSYFAASSPIVTCINGKEYTFSSGHHKTLLRLLREDAGLIGTKEGCAEGECGACTVFLDGVAVMSCLVPAARAHVAKIFTIEGLAKGGKLHPVQQAFIEEGAVQCGYCTPGFLMSAAKLLEERPKPTTDEIRQAITGNLCRCTGYYKIISAIERASQLNPTEAVYE
ncbi:MAG TPA: 2Fe-2S iron-sulfur cluster-binding protein, partial [Anaerolineales bacterium]|nr:2Fe-2S iron-sulfur cluster-binding protein [Anaerolineales bacterium]